MPYTSKMSHTALAYCNLSGGLQVRSEKKDEERKVKREQRKKEREAKAKEITHARKK